MKKFTMMLLLVFVTVSGCNTIDSKISEEQAKSMVIEQHTKQVGEVEIISITKKFNEYIVEWENEKNCEKGIDSVNMNGEIKMVEASIC